ncbi:MAG: hypothetical protein IT410_04565 [Candidatus Doudnabacteria bacterium]|nr:hypothetical protein [Candidatus Doudnabacteria bacterium]
MKLSRQTKIWVGTVIVLAVVLQVVTYVKYSKLEKQVAGFHESLAVAQDESEAANAYDVFYDQTTPLLKAQEASAGRRWFCFWLCSTGGGASTPSNANPPGGEDDWTGFYGSVKPRPPIGE